jgi:hypothetical protein
VTAAGVSGISGEFSGRLVTKSLESVGADLSSVEGAVCSALTLGLLSSSEHCGSLRYNKDHRGTLIKGCFFLPGVAAVDDIIRSSAVCANEFNREDGGG